MIGWKVGRRGWKAIVVGEEGNNRRMDTLFGRIKNRVFVGDSPRRVTEDVDWSLL